MWGARFSRWIAHPGLWPTLIVAVLVALLVGLGLWQLDRREEKAALVRLFEARARSEAVALPVALDEATPGELGAWAFRRVRLGGQFLHSAEILIRPRTRRSEAGAEVITPLLRDEGLPVLVNRGFVPDERVAPDRRPESRIEGRLEVEGLVVLPSPSGPFTPANKPEKEQWFSTDIPAIAAHVGLGRAAPFTVWAVATRAERGEGAPAGLPIPWQVDVAFPSDHLQYALTWFSLAGALGVMYVLALARRLRPSRRPGRKGHQSKRQEVRMPAYAELEDRFRRLTHLSGISQLLHWDMATVMPPGGAETRGEQLATLAVLAHREITDPRLAELLEEVMSEDGLGEWQRANVREMERQRIHASALPADLVEARARAQAACGMAWRRARAAADFGLVGDHLAEVVTLEREAAQAKAQALSCDAYDALLDAFEPGMRAARLSAVFGELERFLPDFLPRVLDHQARESPPRSPAGPFPEDAQLRLARSFMERLGFDFAHGRLDVSLHPFCAGAPGDVRVTTRFKEHDFSESLMAVLHETGHALYERGLPTEWCEQPVGRARSMAVHESQALLVEMQVSRSRVFLAFAVNLIREHFGVDGEEWSLGNMIRLCTRVRPGLIRVEADEVTYPAHVILRYRLEKALIEGRLQVADLPDAWRKGMQRLLGIEPADQREGCLQDIHWYEGAFGYFPSYTLGAVMAAQLFQAAVRERPDILPAIGRGDFAPLVEWLRTHVHAKGSLLATDDLLLQVTGRPLDVEAFKTHLERRYLP
ncbi:MAG: hypothetical protein HY521_05465 [Proteobacteria bacterium]|nr:hypothetical protein [Pseudomonadota bacterium]